MSVAFYVVGREPDWEGGGGPYVDLANANARELLALVGFYNDDLCGRANCRAFRRACETALARAGSDAARLGSVSTGALGCTVVDGGREAGYTTRKLTALRDLAATGGDLGTIEWG